MTDQGQQLVERHGALLGLQVRQVVLDHLVRDSLGKLLTQLLDPGKHPNRTGSEPASGNIKNNENVSPGSSSPNLWFCSFQNHSV